MPQQPDTVTQKFFIHPEVSATLFRVESHRGHNALEFCTVIHWLRGSGTWMAEHWEETTPNTSEYVRNLALGIQSELDRRGMSVNGLSKLSGIPASTITGLFDREFAPDLITLEQICQSLDVDAETVFLRGRTLWLDQHTRRPTDHPPIFMMPFPGE